jgi:hypothetical protein
VSGCTYSGCINDALPGSLGCRRHPDATEPPQAKIRRLERENATLLGACEAIVHWWSVDSSEFARDSAFRDVELAIALVHGNRKNWVGE